MGAQINRSLVIISVIMLMGRNQHRQNCAKVPKMRMGLTENTISQGLVGSGLDTQLRTEHHETEVRVLGVAREVGGGNGVEGGRQGETPMVSPQVLTEGGDLEASR